LLTQPGPCSNAIFLKVRDLKTSNTAILFCFKLIENLHSLKGFMNFIGELKHLHKLNFSPPIINMVMIAPQRLKTHGTKLPNNLQGTCTFTVKPNRQIGFHNFALHFNFSAQKEINPFGFTLNKIFAKNYISQTYLKNSQKDAVAHTTDKARVNSSQVFLFFTQNFWDVSASRVGAENVASVELGSCAASTAYVAVFAYAAFALQVVFLSYFGEEL